MNLTSKLQHCILSCQLCPRLREHCQKISQEKKKAYRHQDYWGKPILGFGDLHAKLGIVGLAPGAHGANRTGRIFTGDRSGQWLYRALYKSGFANQPESTHLTDGLQLKDTYVTCLVKCAPPDNKPLILEQRNCRGYLEKEIAILSQVRVWIALGRIAFDGLWPLLSPESTKPPFKHAAKIPLSNGKILLLSYHPSQQNTFTGRLTESMFDSVFNCAKEEIKYLLLK